MRLKVNLTLLAVMFLLGIFGAVAFYLSSAPLKYQFKCRENFLKPKKTGIVGEPVKNQYMSLVDVNTCLLEFKTGSSSVNVLVGLFDNFGRMHAYPARIGGQDYNGKQISPSVCRKDEVGGTSCTSLGVNNIITELSQYETASLQFILEDNAPWENSRITRDNSGFFHNFENSIKTGKDFPRIPSGKEFYIQIWQLNF